jgi:hypothetical protein
MRYHRTCESSHTTIEQPLCPKCQIRMMLASIALSSTGPDLRTFECPQCELDYRAPADDPMRSSKAAGWIKGELRQPIKLSDRW